MDGLQARDYCMKCKQPVTDGVSHNCPIKQRVLADDVMTGIADKLYNLGIVPKLALVTLDKDDLTELYSLKIFVGLYEHLKVEILGELPVGWSYCWDEDKVHMLEYSDFWYSSEAEDAMTRINAVVGEFEVYLDSKDAKAIKAMSLLMTY